MSEDPIETHELRERLEESHELAREGGERWTVYLSLSTAIIAVVASVASLQSGANESHALLAKNEAILAQSRASDQWSYFQAKSTKAAIFEAQAEVAESAELKGRLEARQKTYKAEQKEIEAEARKLEQEVKAHDEEGEAFFHRHHRFAMAVTIFQVSIALSAIAALTRRQPVWWVSMLVGASGLVFLAMGWGLLGG
jgi:Domain of unknown function (DUF4337)